VKNNLQLVMSLLNLHARRIRDPRAELAFAEARGRINALATLHRRLYESENLQHVEVRWFLEDLCSELRRSGLAGGRNIELAVEAPAGEVIGPEVAVPLGLLVTEAITNAYKHAFAGRVAGRIDVILTREPDGTFCAIVRDDGTGYGVHPAPPKDSEQSGLGHSLIEAFARQLRGQLDIESSGGTLIKVRFPLQGPVAPVRETRAA
jgi:two-component sensor histidine kinase